MFHSFFLRMSHVLTNHNLTLLAVVRVSLVCRRRPTHSCSKVSSGGGLLLLSGSSPCRRVSSVSVVSQGGTPSRMAGFGVTAWRRVAVVRRAGGATPGPGTGKHHVEEVVVAKSISGFSQLYLADLFLVEPKLGWVKQFQLWSYNSKLPGTQNDKFFCFDFDPT